MTGISHGSTSLDPEMVYGIASVTKMFTATLVLKLVEDEILSLDDTIGDWLPSYPNVDASITLRQLLNHTSGVYEMWSHPGIMDSIGADMSRIWSDEEAITTFVLEPYFSPGNGWRYSSSNYVLLSMVIREATGSAFHIPLRSGILSTLGLDQTYVDIDETITSPIAHGWDDVDGDGIAEDVTATYERTSHNSLARAAGGMYSNPGDLVHFSQALFEGGLLSTASLSDMLDFYTPIPSGGQYTEGYGLGIALHAPAYVGDETAYGHSGYMYGYLTLLAYFPDYGAHITVVVNTSSEPCQVALMRNLLHQVKTIYPVNNYR